MLELLAEIFSSQRLHDEHQGGILLAFAPAHERHYSNSMRINTSIVPQSNNDHPPSSALPWDPLSRIGPARRHKSAYRGRHSLAGAVYAHWVS